MSSTELTPFAEVIAPTGTAPTGTAPTGTAPAAPVGDQTLGRMAAVATWLAPRLAGQGPLARPRSIVIVGDVDGPTGLTVDDSAAGQQLADAVGVGSRRVEVATDAATGEFAITGRQPSPVAADVLSREQAIEAVDAGRRLADQEIDSGADLIVPGLAGDGHAVVLGVLTSVLTGLEPVLALPLADTDIDGWVTAVSELRDALFRIRDQDKDVVSLLTAVGGADVGVLAGLIAQCAVRRTPVLLDGLPATVAAVLAHRLAPGADAWFIAAGEATTRSGRRLQEMLGVPMVAALDTDSPCGAGGLLVLPLIQAALGASPAPAPTAGTASPEVSLVKTA